jgi:hypothetical protein
MLICRTRAPPPALRLSAPGLCLRRLRRPYGPCLLRLPTPNGLWTTGLSIPEDLRPPESALSPAPACVQLAPRAALVPASQSCLSVPVVAEVRLAPRLNLPGVPFRMLPLRASSLRCLPKPFLKLRLAPPLLARPFRTCLPVSDLLCLARALRLVRPSSLPLPLPSGFRPPASAPAPPRARSAL